MWAQPVLRSAHSSCARFTEKKKWLTVTQIQNYFTERLVAYIYCSDTGNP